MLHLGQDPTTKLQTQVASISMADPSTLLQHLRMNSLICPLIRVTAREIKDLRITIKTQWQVSSRLAVLPSSRTMAKATLMTSLEACQTSLPNTDRSSSRRAASSSDLAVLYSLIAKGRECLPLRASNSLLQCNNNSSKHHRNRALLQTTTLAPQATTFSICLAVHRSSRPDKHPSLPTIWTCSTSNQIRRRLSSSNNSHLHHSHLNSHLHNSHLNSSRNNSRQRPSRIMLQLPMIRLPSSLQTSRKA